MGEWERRNQVLDSLRKTLKENPANIELANSYWCALAGDAAKGEADYRSGHDVIEAYREAAISSSDGAMAFADAYRELCDLSGESPRLAYFDESLIQALRKCHSQLSEKERCAIEWVLKAIKE
jgi:hypothetical protein